MIAIAPFTFAVALSQFSTEFVALASRFEQRNSDQIESDEFMFALLDRGVRDWTSRILEDAGASEAASKVRSLAEITDERTAKKAGQVLREIHDLARYAALACYYAGDSEANPKRAPDPQQIGVYAADIAFSLAGDEKDHAASIYRDIALQVSSLLIRSFQVED